MNLAKNYLVMLVIVQMIYVMFPRIHGVWLVLTSVCTIGAAAGCAFDMIARLRRRRLN